MNDTAKPWERPDFDDNPEWTEEDFARAKPASEVLGKEAAAGLVRKRGRPAGSKNATSKEQIALRVDADIVAAFKATGPGWQTRMNEALGEAVKFAVVDTGDQFAVVERRKRRVPSETAMASFQGSTRLVGAYPSKAQAEAEATRRNQGERRP